MFPESGYGAAARHVGDFRGRTLAGGHMIKAAERVGGQAGATVIPAAGGPTVLRILLGAQLRRLREAKRISFEDQPAGDGPGRIQGPRYHRSAHVVWRNR